MDIDLKVTRNWRKHQATTKKIVVSQGGGRSGKTFSILQLLILEAINNRNLLISVVAENVPFLKRGAIRDFRTIMDNIFGFWLDENWNRTDSVYDFGNGSKMEFFAADSAGKAVGAARDHLFINEANNVKYEIAFQLMARTRERTFIDFNPVAEFWVHTEILNNPAFDGQVDYVHSTFIDNQMLSDSIKETMLARAAIDKNYETVYIKGEVGSLEGLVFPNINLIDTIPEGGTVVYGLDFGYSQDPTALVKVIEQGDKIYIDELIYQTGLRNSDISNLMKQHGVNRPIYADSSEPKTIDDLYLMGHNVHPVVKGKDSIMWGVDLMKQKHIHVTKRSLNIIKEFRNYTYDKDKEGKLLNKPIDLFNHGIDAIRYAVMMIQRKRHEYTTADTIDNNRRL